MLLHVRREFLLWIGVNFLLGLFLGLEWSDEALVGDLLELLFYLLIGGWFFEDFWLGLKGHERHEVFELELVFHQVLFDLSSLLLFLEFHLFGLSNDVLIGLLFGLPFLLFWLLWSLVNFLFDFLLTEEMLILKDLIIGLNIKEVFLILL